MPLKILLLRHGQTQGNLERRYIGSTDQPLCIKGRAALFNRKLPPVDRIYTSPLLRCGETAAILFPNQPAEPVYDLRECSFGAFENRTYEELKDDPAYRAWLDTGGETSPPRRREQIRAKIPYPACFPCHCLPARGGDHCPGGPRRNHHDDLGITGTLPRVLPLAGGKRLRLPLHLGRSRSDGGDIH